MLAILSIPGVIFVVIALGYLSVRIALFSAADMKVFGKYVVNFALPALVFRGVSGQDIGRILDVGYLAAYLGGSLLVFAGGYVWSRTVTGLTPTACTFQGMGMSCANSGFVGYPILLMALPPVAATAFALNMIVENLVMIPLVLILAERAESGAVQGGALFRQIAGRVIRNPIVIALFAALAVSLTGVALPDVIAKPIELIGASSAAMSLIVIGGTLAGLRLRAIDARVIPVAVGKLLLHPLAVWLGLLTVGVAGVAVADERLAHAAILMAAMPPMGIYPILAQRYGEENAAALAMLVMTALSFFTISVVLWLLGAGPAV